MKKLFLLVISSALLFTSCGPSEEGNGPSTSTSVPTSETSGITPTSTSIPTSTSSYIGPTFVDFSIQKRLYDDVNYEYYYEVTPTSFLASISNYERIPNYFYGGSFSNKLTTPNYNVSSLEELTYVLDYSSFYKIKDIDVTFNGSYSGFISAEKEINKAVWNSSLIIDVVGIKVTSSSPTYHIELMFNEIAATAYKLAPLKNMINPYLTSNNDLPKITNVPYTPTRGNLDVYNSDQLLYALENGFNPVCSPNSVAKKVYDKAVEVLKNLIVNPSDTYQNLYLIQDYLVTHTNYDFETEELAGAKFDDENYYPFKVASSFCSYYAEGALLYGNATSTGLTKAESILFSLMNIPHRRVSGGIPTDLSLGINSKNLDDGYYYESYNYFIDTDSKYYICHPTFNYDGEPSLAGPDDIEYSSIIRRAGVLLSHNSWSLLYSDINDVIYEYYTDDLSNNDLDIGTSMEVTPGTYPYVISVMHLNNLLPYIIDSIDNYKTRYSITTENMYYCVILLEGNSDTFDAIDDALYNYADNGTIYDYRITNEPALGLAYGGAVYIAR